MHWAQADAVTEASFPRPEKRARKSRKPIRRGSRPRRQRKSTPAALKRRLWELLRAYVADAWGDRCFTCGAGPLERGGADYRWGRITGGADELEA
jgi:hypothetical protein